MGNVNGRKFTEKKQEKKKKKEKKKKNKVEEFQLAKPASLGSLASKNQSVAWYACEAVLGKETYGRLNGRKTRTTVP